MWKKCCRMIFFIRTYSLSSRKNYFELGLYDEKNGAVDGDFPWLTAGLHRFNAVYISVRLERC